MADERSTPPSYDRPIFGHGAKGVPPVPTKRRRLGLQGKLFLFTIVALAAAAATAYVYLRPEADRYVLDNYQVITVGTHDFRTLFITVGRVIPDEVVVYTAPNFSSTSLRASVERVHVRPGDDVSAGQVLIELVSEGLFEERRRVESEFAAAEIELAQARLQAEQESAQKVRELAQARAALEDAQEHAALLEQLYEQGGIARKELENAIAAVEARLVEIESAEHALEIARRRGELNVRKAENQVQTLAKELAALAAQEAGLTIRADRNGRILSLNASPGQLVAQGAELVSLADLRAQHVEAAITPEQALELRPGMSAVLRFGGYSVPATVDFVSPQATVTSEGSAVPTRLALDPKFAVNLVPNTEVSVEIELGTREGRLALLRGPFFASGDASFVYVVSEDGRRAQRRDVRFGAIDGGVVEILEGLQLGERIIYSSYSAFRAYPVIDLLPEGGRTVAWQ